MENKKQIENLIKKESQGLTIQNISDELEGANKINIKEVGKAKLHYWKI